MERQPLKLVVWLSSHGEATFEDLIPPQPLPLICHCFHAAKLIHQNALMLESFGSWQYHLSPESSEGQTSGSVLVPIGRHTLH